MGGSGELEVYGFYGGGSSSGMAGRALYRCAVLLENGGGLQSWRREATKGGCLCEHSGTCCAMRLQTFDQAHAVLASVQANNAKSICTLPNMDSYVFPYQPRHSFRPGGRPV